MGIGIKTLCPVCGQTLNTRCYRDPNVGIEFDFDVLAEGTNCTCDTDEESIFLQQYEKLHDAYWTIPNHPFDTKVYV